MNTFCKFYLYESNENIDKNLEICVIRLTFMYTNRNIYILLLTKEHLLYEI